MAILTIGFTPLVAAQSAPPRAETAPATQAAPTSAADLDRLFAELAMPSAEGDDSWRRAQSDILRIWSQSGSAAMDLLHRRGVAALDEGDAVTAIGHLTALVDHAPDFATGYVDRAAAYAAHGDFGPAAADLAQALTLEPRQFTALTQLGAMLEDMGDLPRALAAFQASLKINPHQPEAIDAVARLQQAMDGIAL
ncbi:hypothetical protein DRW48_08825 [Paracoccus suum]|uniref:Uncharacterized protein n=1 Tax=Paracoccus suum TaxID=2259340 RepID=A0A344PK72_9RHOB|nr:hypothetical protein [Paracoccus suum]AXC49777.1 hypothetical protein DRW48_08825 [Paracoccus suum]